jgi:hypothetical protein
MRNRIRMFLLIVACAGAAACGSGSAAQSTRSPVIPRALASDLEARADSVAVSLGAQHSCAALDQARQLGTAVDAAIAAGRVPAALQPQLQAATTRLVAGIRCTPPPPARPKPKPPGHDRKHHDRKHQGPGKHDQGDGE